MLCYFNCSAVECSMLNWLFFFCIMCVTVFDMNNQIKNYLSWKKCRWCRLYIYNKTVHTAEKILDLKVVVGLIQKKLVFKNVEKIRKIAWRHKQLYWTSQLTPDAPWWSNIGSKLKRKIDFVYNFFQVFTPKLCINIETEYRKLKYTNSWNTIESSSSKINSEM